MDLTANERNPNEVRAALARLSGELENIYEKAMERITSWDSDDQHLAEQVLCWVSCALRPLTATELQHALAVVLEQEYLDKGNIIPVEILASIYGDLVTVHQRSNIIRFVHRTAEQYFERLRQRWFPNAQATIAIACLTYISFNVFSEGFCSTDKEMENRLLNYPFLEYAAQHWGDHARGEPEELIKTRALKFLEHNSKLMCSNQVLHLPTHRYYTGYSQHFLKDVSGLQVAASFGLQK